MQVQDNSETTFGGNGVVEGEIKRSLTFLVHGEVYGVDISNVKEIIEFGNITKVPMMPSFVAGVINLRGSVVPVIDLAQRFSFEARARTKKSSIIILEYIDDGSKLELGITVEQVNEVLDIAVTDIEPTPAFGTNIRTDFIEGMGKVNEKLLVLLNIEHTLAVSELSN